MANIFKAFIDLLPVRPLQAGTVLSISGGVAAVELPGGVLQARNAATAGQCVFVRDGLIEGTTPDLLIEVIEI